MKYHFKCSHKNQHIVKILCKYKSQTKSYLYLTEEKEVKLKEILKLQLNVSSSQKKIFKKFL